MNSNIEKAGWEVDLIRTWWESDSLQSSERLPGNWTGVHGAEAGYYWCNVNDGERRNPNAWTGPFSTEEEAMIDAEREAGRAIDEQVDNT